MTSHVTDLDLNNPFVMANDYIKYRLEIVGMNWYGCPDLPDVTDARLTMRILACDFEQRYHSEMVAMIRELNITVYTIYPIFKGLVEQLFRDGINWGRIIALYAFGGALALDCAVNDERRTLVGQVAEWIAIFTRNRLEPWIQLSGGWSAFVSWYEEDISTTRYHTLFGLISGSTLIIAIVLTRMLFK